MPPLTSHTRKGPEHRAWKPQFRQKRKRLRSPAGPRRLRDSDAHKRIAVPQALCVLREHLRPRLKSGKVCRSDTRPGDVRERAACVEGNDSAPVRNAPCFAVCAVVCDPVGEGECVPAFDCESKRGPFVGEVEKRDERWSEVELLLIVGATENREMYVYKSVAESRLQMRRSEQFHWRHKAPLWTREGRPLFRRVSRCVRSFSESRVCTHFCQRKQTWAICARS